jgi:hypothetical protein
MKLPVIIAGVVIFGSVLGFAVGKIIVESKSEPLKISIKVPNLVIKHNPPTKEEREEDACIADQSSLNKTYEAKQSYCKCSLFMLNKPKAIELMREKLCSSSTEEVDVDLFIRSLNKVNFFCEGFKP